MGQSLVNTPSCLLSSQVHTPTVSPGLDYFPDVLISKLPTSAILTIFSLIFHEKNFNLNRELNPGPLAP